MTEKALTEALDAIETLRRIETSARSEVEHLRKIKEWALEQQPVHAEDAVTLKESFPPPVEGRDTGWYCYREALVPGATGIVERVDWNEFSRSWQALVRFDAMWSVHYGLKEKRRYIKEHGLFSINVKHLRLRRADDTTPTIPEGTVSAR